MRSGTAWRIAVLASLALLVSGQLCMLTTCLPRLHSSRNMAAAHACCRGPAAGRSAPQAPVSATEMPCSVSLTSVSAPVLDGAMPSMVPAALLVAATVQLAPPTGLSVPAFATDTGPPPEHTQPATAGLRAPPIA